MTPLLETIRDAKVERILLIRRRALGDALVNLPAVRALRTAFPDAAVDLLIDRPFVDAVAALIPGVRVIGWPPAAPGAGFGGRWLLRGYDLVVDFLSTPATALLTALSGARWRVGYDLDWRRWAYNIRVPRNRFRACRLSQFAGESFLDPLRVLGLETRPWRQSAEAEGGRPAAGPRIEDWWRRTRVDGAVHVSVVMSATWPAKAWPADHAARMVRLLKQAGLVPILVPGPGDASYTREMLDRAPDLRVAPPTDLRDLAFLLEAVDIHVGTDNGSRHLAAAVGTRTVTIFGPTDPSGWNPEDPRHVSVGLDLDCMPCDLKVCPLPGHPCLAGLEAEKPAEAVIGMARQLDRGGDRGDG